MVTRDFKDWQHWKPVLFTVVKKVYIAGHFQAFLLSYNNTTHMATDSPMSKPFCLLLLELDRHELHCPVNYYKCFISLQRINSLPLALILFLCSQNMLWLWKSVSPALLGAKTLQWLAHFLSSSLHWLRYAVLKYNLLSWRLIRSSLH